MKGENLAESLVSVAKPTPLLERDLELGTIDAFFERVRFRRGGRILIEGPAGIGKSAVLDAAAARARELGMLCLWAEGSEVAAQVAFGVAREALGARWPEEDSLNRGAQLVLDLADETPVMLCIDDVQWADPASLRWLALLAQRISGSRLALALAARSEDRGNEPDPLTQLLDDRGAVVVRPAALSEQASGELLAARLGGALDQELVGWCHEDTGGNPYLLGALADALRQAGIPSGAGARMRVREIGSRAVARSISARLERLDPDARALVEAVAAVGDVGSLTELAAVAGVGAAVAADAGRTLVGYDLLRSLEPMEVSHPLIGEAIRGRLDAQRREELAGRAAARLSDRGMVEEAAARLIDLAPRGDPWVANKLAEAAEGAAARGAADVGTTLLRRALREPPSEADRPAMCASLGGLLTSLGDPEAVTILERALAESRDARRTASLAGQLALALNYARRTDEAVAALDRIRSGFGAEDAEVDEELEALTLHYLSFSPAMRPALLERLGRWGERRGASELAHRQRLAELAALSLNENRPAEDTVALAERALASGVLLSSGIQSHNKAVVSLAYAGRPAAARAHVQDSIAYARNLGNNVLVGFAMAIHGEIRRLEGEMLAAEIDIRTGLDLLPPGELGPRFMLRGLVESLVEQGRVTAAERELRQGQLTGELPEVMPTPGLLYARARVRIASGQPALGLEDLLRGGEIAERLPLRDPVSVPWRLAAAEALLALGDLSRAGQLAAEHLELARASGLPEAVGAALRVQGLVSGGEAGRKALAEAVELLDGGWSRLELARALVDLGAATYERNRVDGRRLLERGATLAEELGAIVLAARAGELSVAAGSRPRRAARRGPAALSAAERRTARLAAEGMTNREIAQTLVLSEKTVESQLRAAFRKLGVSSRRELPVAVGGTEPPAEPALA
jgi:DNA-binding CsgD family transcriptional regulator/tetratricopeptide (TPR) repeat protein